MRIIIDADACPLVVKQVLYKTLKRFTFELILVANQKMRIPESEQIRSVVVPEGPDEADDYIVEILEPGDLVISADIPLADRVIKKAGMVLDPRGKLFTQKNIGERLAMRNLMDDLRTGGMVTGGPRPYSNREKQDFTNQLDRLLTRTFKTK